MVGRVLVLSHCLLSALTENLCLRIQAAETASICITLTHTPWFSMARMGHIRHLWGTFSQPLNNSHGQVNQDARGKGFGKGKLFAPATGQSGRAREGVRHGCRIWPDLTPRYPRSPGESLDLTIEDRRKPAVPLRLVVLQAFNRLPHVVPDPP